MEPLGQREGQVVGQPDGDVERVLGDFGHVVAYVEEHFVDWRAGLGVGLVSGQSFFEIQFGTE